MSGVTDRVMQKFCKIDSNIFAATSNGKDKNKRNNNALREDTIAAVLELIGSLVIKEYVCKEKIG